MPEVHLDWGLDGVKFAVKNGDIIVIVDTIRFSSTVITAIANGFVIYPISDMENGKTLASSIGAELAGKTGHSKFSLSPLSFSKERNNKNKKVVLYSPNGAACSKFVRGSKYAFLGSFLNAKAVGEKITEIALKTNCDVTIIAAGEQRAIKSGEIIEYVKKDSHFVFAVEDYLGCGAIISYISLPKNSESLVCQEAFKSCKNIIAELLHGSFSGKYRAQTNTSNDVDYCAQLNYYGVIPIIKDGLIESLK
jgi:2-phosphosulfolactate phosphatase